MSEVTRACGAVFHSCICAEQCGHDGAHLCRCCGSWTDEGEIIALPQRRDDGTPAMGLYAAIALLMSGKDPEWLDDLQ